MQNSRVSGFCLLVHTQRVLTVQRVTGGFLAHGSTKEQAGGKLPLLPALIMHLSQERCSLAGLFKMKLCKDCSQNGSAHKCENGNGCVFLRASHPTSLREQVTSLLEEAVLQVSFPQSLAEAMLVISNYSGFFLLHVSSLFIDHNPNGSFVCIYLLWSKI